MGLSVYKGPVGGGGGAHVSCLNFTSSYVNILQESYVFCRNLSNDLGGFISI